MFDDAENAAGLQYAQGLAGEGKTLRRRDVVVNTNGSYEINRVLRHRENIVTELEPDIKILAGREHPGGWIAPHNMCKMLSSNSQQIALPASHIEPRQRTGIRTSPSEEFSYDFELAFMKEARSRCELFPKGIV
jgi:hypothetical protein